MSDDFDTFKSDDGGEPPDGNHTATLVRAVIRETDSGWHGLILEWQTIDLAHYWTSFHGVSGKQRQFTQKLLRELGVDYSKLDSWDELGDELATVENKTFVVNVRHSGNFLNTDVVERPEAVQTELPVPASTPPPPRHAIFDDDDIPFVREPDRFEFDPFHSHENR